MIDFLFRLASTLFLILILQISIGGKTLEDYLMDFIRSSESMAPVRDVAYSGIKSIDPDLEIKEPSLDAKKDSSSEGNSELMNMAGGIFDAAISRYGKMLKTAVAEGKKRGIKDVKDKASDSMETLQDSLEKIQHKEDSSSSNKEK